MGCVAAEATGLGFVCFVVINPCVLSANRVYLGFFCFINFPTLSPSALIESRRLERIALAKSSSKNYDVAISICKNKEYDIKYLGLHLLPEILFTYGSAFLQEVFEDWLREGSFPKMSLVIRNSHGPLRDFLILTKQTNCFSNVWFEDGQTANYHNGLLMKRGSISRSRNLCLGGNKVDKSSWVLHYFVAVLILTNTPLHSFISIYIFLMAHTFRQIASLEMMYNEKVSERSRAQDIVDQTRKDKDDAQVGWVCVFKRDIIFFIFSIWLLVWATTSKADKTTSQI